MNKQDLELARKFYEGLPTKIAAVRKSLGRPLTLAEKVVFSHLTKPLSAIPERGKTFLNLLPDRVALQDATAQMALLQFMVTQIDTVRVPTTIHCDHLIQARVGADKDLLKAVDENKEVYEFLRSAAAKYGIGFWKAGAGIIHQVVLEQYAFPGGMMIGTDSHTPNAGGLGMVAVGVGGADAVDVMAGQGWGLIAPKVLGVHLKGRLNGWTSPKDVILKVAGMLTVAGGTGKIVEYFGEGTETISCTGKATITNMGAELGATCSIFPYDKRMAGYLNATKRSDVVKWADSAAAELKADPEVALDPKKYYDEVIEIDLSKLEPGWVGPHTPDLLRQVSEMGAAVKKEGYPDRVSSALIGSCTNSSYEDIMRAAHVAKQAKAHGVKIKSPLLITPGSDQIYKTIQRDGLLEVFTSVGATVLANACGPCIGQWKREDVKEGEKNTIVTSFNRNFARRNDDNAGTLAFIGSPEMVMAAAFSGSLSFNPLVDTLQGADGKAFKFEPPVGDELPKAGYEFSLEGFEGPSDDLGQRKAVKVAISPTSERIAEIDIFKPWNGKDIENLVVLMKAKGKCTTDHISPAGPWLKYRGHLPNISNNMFTGATNFFTGEIGKTTNVLTGEKSVPFNVAAKDYKSKGQDWIAVGDTNYGEGSSREHAAMSPRFLGCRAVVVRSFARIHESNLKKQGVLPLTFVDPASYDLIGENDKVSIVGLTNLAPGSSLTLKIQGQGGVKEAQVKHTLTAEEVRWFKAGSALNTLNPNIKS